MNNKGELKMCIQKEIEVLYNKLKVMNEDTYIKYFDTSERLGWYFMANDFWLYGGETEKECLKSAIDYFNI